MLLITLRETSTYLRGALWTKNEYFTKESTFGASALGKLSFSDTYNVGKYGEHLRW